MKHVIWILLGKVYIIYIHTKLSIHIQILILFHSPFNFYSNYHATCFQVPPRAMAGMSAEDFVEEHLVDKTFDEVRRDISMSMMMVGCRLKEIKVVRFGNVGCV